MDSRRLYQLINEGKEDFVLYRLPGSEQVVFIQGHFRVNEHRNLPESSFVISPFDNGQTLLIDSDYSDELPLTEFENDHAIQDLNLIEDAGRERYFRQAGKIIDQLRSGEYDKIVLARKKVFSTSQKINIPGFFIGLCEKYINSFVYLFRYQQDHIWMGATPELLVRKKSEKLESASLAGTITRQTHDNILLESVKDKLEQEIVTNYIKRIFDKHCHNIKTGSPQVINTGNLKHIQTIISGSPSETFDLGDFIKDLHPTPAVCGIPKESAFSYIQQNEDFNREFYAGYLGVFRSIMDFNFFVNLRCMKIEDERITLYAGSGLVAESTVEEEFEETENKFNTLLSVF